MYRSWSCASPMPEGSGIDQYARVENCIWIERAFRRGEGARKTLGPLHVVPSPMVAADRMMVSDSAAEPDQFARHRGLDLVPLLQFRAAPARRQHCVVGRRSV